MVDEGTAGLSMTQIRETMLNEALDAQPFTPVKDWWQRAACRDADREMFFAERGDSATPARLICWSCPLDVRLSCVTREVSLTYGVFGGLTPRERVKVKHRIIERGGTVERNQFAQSLMNAGRASSTPEAARKRAYRAKKRREREEVSEAGNLRAA